jgi:hypothetical protein
MHMIIVSKLTGKFTKQRRNCARKAGIKMSRDLLKTQFETQLVFVKRRSSKIDAVKGQNRLDMLVLKYVQSTAT